MSRKFREHLTNFQNDNQKDLCWSTSVTVDLFWSNGKYCWRQNFFLPIELSICFVRIFKKTSAKCFLFSGLHKPEQQVRYSRIIRLILKIDFVDKYQNLFCTFVFSFTSIILLSFFNFNILNSGYSPKFIFSKFLRFGHPLKFISSKCFILLIRKRKCLQQNEEY